MSKNVFKFLYYKYYMSRNYYNILGISEKSEQSEIKRAYRKLSLEHHPDKGGDEEKFKEVNEAYTTLGDSDKKREYDMQRRGGGMNMGMGMNRGMGMNTGGLPPDVFNMFFGGRGDPFSQFGHPMSGMGGPNIRVFHNGRQMPQQPKKPEPIKQTIFLTLKQAYEGSNAFMVSIHKRVTKNSATNMENETIYIEIPEGIDDNEKVYLKNRGHILDNLTGDIEITFKVNNDTSFIREGMNITINKEVSLKEALCGFSFEIDHINGKNYKISNQSGNIVKPGYIREICGMGMKRNGQIGRLFIKFNINFPEKLSDKQIENISDIL
jgi:curved DNA-binding protein